MRAVRFSVIVLAVAVFAAAGVYAALEVEAPVQSSLAAFVPPGALLALESPDFAALLRSWNSSSEQRRWLAGDDYAAFSRSRLFGRLGNAQSEFAAAAGLAPDGRFLEQVAGSQSLFAWYDIGNLEFLYITRLPSEQAARVPLLALRDKFEQRQAGGVTFYVHSSEDASAQPASGASGDGADSARPRLVAFAVRGDMLLLATREDLIAGALEQMAHPGGRSLATDPWYAAGVAAANEKPGDLRLTLDLAKISRSPYFRTYWVQQNITTMRGYTAALSDLYREPGLFREQRFLLPAGSVQPAANADLGPALHFLPSGVVYRAVAHPSAEDTLSELGDKLLARTSASIQSPHEAPTANLTVPNAGDPSDLDDRIDAPQAPPDARAAGLAGLQSLLAANTPVAMLSFSNAGAVNQTSGSAETEERGSVYGAVHTGIALVMPTPCDVKPWQQALAAALSPRVSVGNAGLRWREETSAKTSWFRFDGYLPLVFAADGNTCLFASDSDTLLAMTSANGADITHQVAATSVAGFSHASQRAPLLKLASLLDHKGGGPATSAFRNGSEPPFFSGNMASLSNAFEDFDSETFTEFDATPTLTRQTVTYRWRSH